MLRMYENLSDLLKQIALGEDSVLEFSGDKVAGPHPGQSHEGAA
jgi:hypothetical protein